MNWSVSDATTVRFYRYIAFAERLCNKIRNGCEGLLSIVPYAADIFCLFFSDILGLTISIPETEVVTSTLCFVCVLTTTFCAIQIEIWRFFNIFGKFFLADERDYFRRHLFLIIVDGHDGHWVRVSWYDFTYAKRKVVP